MDFAFELRVTFHYEVVSCRVFQLLLWSLQLLLLFITYMIMMMIVMMMISDAAAEL